MDTYYTTYDNNYQSQSNTTVSKVQHLIEKQMNKQFIYVPSSNDQHLRSTLSKYQ
jgi:hypothetical protein